MTIRYPLLTIGSENFNTDKSVGRNKTPIYTTCYYYIPSLVRVSGFSGIRFVKQTFFDPGPILRTIRYSSVAAWIQSGKPTIGLQTGTLSGYWAVNYNRTFWPVKDFREVPEGTMPDSLSNINHNAVSGGYDNGVYVSDYQDVGYTFQETDDNKNGEVVNQLLDKWLSITGNPDYNLAAYYNVGTTGWYSKSAFHPAWRNGGIRPQFTGVYRSAGSTVVYYPTNTNIGNNQTYYNFTSTSMADTYKYAGDYQTNVSAYPAGNDVKTQTNSYIWYRGWVRDNTYNSTTSPPSVPDEARPLYYASDGSLTQMTDAEIDEAFIIPAIEKFASAQPWLISTSDSVAEYTRWVVPLGYDGFQSPSQYRTTIMIDSRANTENYSDLLGTNKSATNISSYYVHGRTSYPYSLTEDSIVVWDNGMKVNSLTNIFDLWAPRLLWYVTRNASSNEYLLSLQHATTTLSQTTYTALDGSTQYKNRWLGTVTNTFYSGTTKKTRFVGTDDYRSQLWPSGTLSSNSWYTYIRRPNI